MRIGIDCRSILHPEAGESAGVGHYVHHLVAALLREDVRNEYVLFFDNRDVAEAKRDLLRGNPRVTARALPFRTLRRAMPFVYSHLVVSSVFDRERLDLLHGPANVVPFFYRRPWVVTVHDLAIYDHPEWFPAGSLGTQTFSKSVLVPHSLRHARRVIAVSQATKRDAMRIFGLDERKIDVVYEGAEPPDSKGDPGAALSRLGLAKGDYLLWLGTVEPRKNVAAAIRAFAHAARRGWLPERVDFVLAGRRGWKDRTSFDAIRDANEAIGGTRARVRYVGYLSAEDKHAVTASAGAFIFPSLYEGFGLPPLEAMAAGVPVIASDTAAVAEVCGDAALLVAPTDEEGFAHAIRAVWNDRAEAERLRDAGLRRAADFSWRKAARETLAVYERSARTAVSSVGHDIA
ncbi:MAG TPA: glycosyltransferase family 1 protein [Patescibacteria group bacterium]|nr:glycosyltransferase family 1 protein [Patescibacteria group bacterium]